MYELIILSGLPASGKTTAADYLNAGLNTHYPRPNGEKNSEIIQTTPIIIDTLTKAGLLHEDVTRDSITTAMGDFSKNAEANWLAKAIESVLDTSKRNHVIDNIRDAPDIEYLRSKHETFIIYIHANQDLRLRRAYYRNADVDVSSNFKEDFLRAEENEIKTYALLACKDIADVVIENNDILMTKFNRELRKTHFKILESDI